MEKNHITARITKSLAEKMKAMAKKDGKSFSNMVGRLLEEATKLDSKKKNAPRLGEASF